MRELFKIEINNYNPEWEKFYRPSSRAIIIKNNKIGLIHSVKYDYYKFPGGGIENNESKIDALIRETKEEAGLIIKEDSIKEFGVAKRIEKGKFNNIFIQDNYYYLCDVKDESIARNLDNYEAEEKFTFEYVDPRFAIEINRTKDHGPKSNIMIERESKVLEILIKEKLI